MSKKKHLNENDFPVAAEDNKVVTTNKEPVAQAENDQLAEEIAERLNDEAWRRHEDNWSA
jgi:hypothetical protein